MLLAVDRVAQTVPPDMTGLAFCVTALVLVVVERPLQALLICELDAL